MLDDSTERLVQNLREVLLEYLEDIILLLDQDMVVGWANTAALKALNTSKFEIIGHRLDELEYPFLSQLCAIPKVKNAVRLRIPQRSIEVTENNISWEVVIFPLLQGGVHVGTAILAHQLGILPAEYVNRIKEFQWRTIFDALGYPTMIVDPSHTIRGANRVLLETFGFEAETDLIGKKCFSVFHHTDEPISNCPVDAVLRSLHPEISNDEIDQLGRLFKVSTIPAFDDSGKLQHIFHVAIDFTEKIRAKEAAQLFLDVLSHDVANLLQALEFGIALQDENESDAIARRKIIEDAIDRISRLVSKARTLNGLEEYPLEEVSLTKIVDESVRQFETMYPNAHFEFQRPQEDIIIHANRYAPRIFSIILENAIIHNSRKDKRVWIEIRETSMGHECIISDNGKGITDDEKTIIFDSARRFGGIGLLQAKIIANKFGAYITISDRVANHPEQGASVTIRFPKVT
ncbi:MAG: PAS domain-containing sensor histidine kinase [Candidatus Thorarchaeota archaeon]|nr:PAS domain-containing sensor histidine kinase [Candidatus Thorarchaeota archaeon]